MKQLKRKVLLALHVLKGRRLWRAWGAGKRFDLMDPQEGPILILAPHADDEIIGCGSALLSYRQAGAPVTVGLVTDGRRAQHPTLRDSDLARMRFQEITRVCAEVGSGLVGPAIPEVAELPEDRVAKWLSDLLSAIKPAVVYSPFPLDTHPHHRQVSACLAQTVASLPGLRVRWYEINVALTPFLATACCETGPLLARRRHLADLYPSQSHIRFDAHFAQLLINSACVPGSRRVEWYAEIPAGEATMWVTKIQELTERGHEILPTVQLRYGIENCRQMMPFYQSLAELSSNKQAVHHR